MLVVQCCKFYQAAFSSVHCQCLKIDNNRGQASILCYMLLSHDGFNCTVIRTSELRYMVSLYSDVQRLAIARFRFLREDLRSGDAADGCAICIRPWAASSSMSTGPNAADAAGGLAAGGQTPFLICNACFLAAAVVVGLLGPLLAALTGGAEAMLRGCNSFSPAASAEDTEGTAEPSTSNFW